MHCNTKAVQHFRVKVMYVVMRLCVPSHSEAYTCVKWALLKGHTQSMAIETMQLYHLDAAVSLLHGSFKHLSSGSGKNCVALQTYCFLSVPIKFFFFLFVSTSTLWMRKHVFAVFYSLIQWSFKLRQSCGVLLWLDRLGRLWNLLCNRSRSITESIDYWFGGLPCARVTWALVFLWTMQKNFNRVRTGEAFYTGVTQKRHAWLLQVTTSTLETWHARFHWRNLQL